MELESIMLNEISQAEKDKYHMISLSVINKKQLTNKIATDYFFPGILKVYPKVIHFFPNTIDLKNYSSHYPFASAMPYTKCPCLHFRQYVCFGDLYSI